MKLLMEQWRKFLIEEIDIEVEKSDQYMCPPPTQDIKLNTENRDAECMPGPVSDEEGRLGYCWMHHFKCHSARTCYTWAAGGPIDEDTVSHEWQDKSNFEEK